MPSPKRPDPAHTWFVDRSLGRRRVAEVLREAGLSVVTHDELFPQDAPDELWVERVGAEGWLGLAKDSRIRYRESERQQVCTSGAILFVLVTGNATGDEMAASFLRALRRMEQLVRDRPPPFIASVTKRGRVAVVWRP